MTDFRYLTAWGYVLAGCFVLLAVWAVVSMGGCRDYEMSDQATGVYYR